MTAPGASSKVRAVSADRFQCIAPDVVLGEGTTVHPFVNLYGCTVGKHSRVGAFVEIQRDATIGDLCKISTHSFICSGVHIADRVFVGHGVTFVNDRHPRACNPDGSPKGAADYVLEETWIEDDVAIGSGATIMCGLRIGAGATVTFQIELTRVGTPVLTYTPRVLGVGPR